MRPVHTTAVVFAFAGNIIFAGIYHASQRLLQIRLPSERLGAIHFWSWQLIIAAAVAHHPARPHPGRRAGRAGVAARHRPARLLARLRRPLLLDGEAAQPATPASGPVVRHRDDRRVHRRTHRQQPGGPDRRARQLLAAVRRAGRGHPVVVRTRRDHVLSDRADVRPPLLLPAARRRLPDPLLPPRPSSTSGRLAFLFAWAAPQQLLNTALPDWAQTAGAAIGLLLWAPSWAGVLNGLFTVRAAWSRLRSDPVLLFITAALAVLGTGRAAGAAARPQERVAAWLRYTDWTIGHVHATALGWDGLDGGRPALLDGAAAVRHRAPLARRRRRPLLHGRGRHPGLPQLHVDRRRHPGPDVARRGRDRRPGLQLRRDAGGAAHPLLGAAGRRRALPGRLRRHGVEPGRHHPPRARRRRARPSSRPRSTSRPAVRAAWCSAQPVLIAATVIGLAVAAGFANPLAALGLVFIAGLLGLGGLAARRGAGRPRRGRPGTSSSSAGRSPSPRWSPPRCWSGPRSRSRRCWCAGRSRSPARARRTARSSSRAARSTSPRAATPATRR